MASKKVRVENEDRISNLPDAIISYILSFLPTKEAVKTSILASRWRYLFASLSNLDFELGDLFLKSIKKSRRLTIKRFISFVDRVLFFHNATSVEKFRLNCGRGVDSSRVYGWISAALWHRVRHLDLIVYNDDFTTLPAVLFTCRTLVTLKLNIGLVLNVPNGVCLPNLKTLRMRLIEFLNDDSVERLFASCISVEDFCIENCNLKNVNKFTISHPLLKRLTILSNYVYSFDSKYWIVIDAPTLVYFKYYDFVATGYSLLNLQSLVRDEFDLIKDSTKTYNDLQGVVTKLFTGISNVQSLHLSSFPALEMLLFCEAIPLFPNMVQLNIVGYHIDKWKWEKGIANLFSSSPELEKVTFHEAVFSFCSLPEQVPICLFNTMKEIEIYGFTVKKDCIRKTRYFLKNAGALEKLTIRTRFSEQKISKLTDEILALPRKSKHCCISIV